MLYTTQHFALCLILCELSRVLADCLLTAVLDNDTLGHGTFRIRVNIWHLSSRRVGEYFLRVPATCQSFSTWGVKRRVHTCIESESPAVLALVVHYKLPPS